MQRDNRVGKKDRRDARGTTLNQFRRSVRRRAGGAPPGYEVQIRFVDHVEDKSCEWHERAHRWCAAYKRPRGGPVEFSAFQIRGTDTVASVEACRKAIKACVERRNSKDNGHDEPPPPWFGADPRYEPTQYIVDGQWIAPTDAYLLYAKHQLEKEHDTVTWGNFRRDVYRDDVRHKKVGKNCLVHIESLSSNERPGR